MSELAEIVAQRIAARSGEFAVVGLARSGVAVARLLSRAGIPVYASDSSSSDAVRKAADDLKALGVAVDVGGHDLERIARAQVLIVSPGVPPTAPPIKRALLTSVPIVSEVEVALRFLPAMRYIAITGTNGKSTTTALTGHLLEALTGSAAIAGNIGVPVSSLALLEQPPAWAALELSSFQLHDTPGLYPDVGVLTTLSPDHLDRYQSVEEYYSDKKRLFANAVAQSKWVITADSPEAEQMATDVTGELHWFSTKRRFEKSSADAWYDHVSDRLMVLGSPLIDRNRITLTGDHNVANVLAAALAVMIADPAHRTHEAREKIADAIAAFRPLAHRLEPVVDRHGLLWLNDSKATNVDSTIVALAGMTRPTIVLLGGRHKGEPYTSLVPELQRVAKHVIAYGEATQVIVDDLQDLLFGHVPVEAMPDASFEEVLKHARSLAVPGDVVLLSPACSSYDMFENYEERGREFRRLADLLT